LPPTVVDAVSSRYVIVFSATVLPSRVVVILIVAANDPPPPPTVTPDEVVEVADAV
jgi:hypothetical protein